MLNFVDKGRHLSQRYVFGLFVTGLTLIGPLASAQRATLLHDLLRRHPELFGPMLQNPAAYDIQILYTQINRDAQNRPTFRTFRYRTDKERYFYPASTVKLPAVLLALEKLRELDKTGITRDTPMLTDSAWSGQTVVRTDSTSASGLPSVGQYARKILLVSDNDAFNRLYEWLGQCAMNERLYAKGYTNLRIVHRLSTPMTPEQNRRTNPVRFMADGRTLHQQPLQTCDRTPRAPAPIGRGIGYMRGDSLVRQPFSFTDKNYFALDDQQDMLRAILFPEAVAPRKRFNLSADDYRFLYQYMSQLPRETTFPRYDTSYYDSYCKFLLAGDSRTVFPANVRIFNKVGDAYGYLIDNAYIVDFEKGVEFLLSAVIYCNSDGIFNDDRYEYETVGLPFMANLGRVIFDYETKRKRPVKPDLSRFRVPYDQ